jgi:hypothetical protein
LSCWDGVRRAAGTPRSPEVSVEVHYDVVGANRELAGAEVVELAEPKSI